MKDIELIIANMKVCDRHVMMMNMAVTDTKQLFPLSVEVLERLPNASLYPLELLITRFAKLQDTIGQKIFPLVYKLCLDEDPEGKSYIDVMNKLEQIGALESAYIWDRFREIHNSITHEYYDQPALACKELNLCMSASLDLMVYWQYLRKFIDDKILVHHKIESS
jgi:hypothetical protein